jgi:predicted membrane protein
MSSRKGEKFMVIILQIFGFLLAALMIYGGFKMLSRSQYQTFRTNPPIENKNKDNQNKEELNSNNKTDS